MLKDIKSDKYNHKKILSSFFLLFVFPFVFVISPLVFFLFWVVFLFPKFFLLSNILCLLFSCITLVTGWLYNKRRLEFWRMSCWSCIIFGAFWFASFMSGTIYAFAAHSGIRMVSSETRFPMGDITSIDIDSKGRIYCADRSRCRLQIFSNDGEFLKGWFIPISGGDIFVSVEDNNIIRIDNVAFKKTHFYDFSGHLLRTEQDKVKSKFEPSNKLSAADDSGNNYRANKTLCSWQILKIGENKESNLISDPFALSIFATPFPVFGFMLFSLVLIGFSHSFVKKAKRINYSDLPRKSRISEPEKEEFQQDKTGKVNCICEKIDFLDGVTAHNYAKDHLKAINIIDSGRRIEYFCPYTGKLWLMDFTQEAKANQENYSRLKSIPKKE